MAAVFDLDPVLIGQRDKADRCVSRSMSTEIEDLKPERFLRRCLPPASAAATRNIERAASRLEQPVRFFDELGESFDRNFALEIL
jgi:hypothetical protein